jgi:DNA-binding transcriptional regulator YiaG
MAAYHYTQCGLDNVWLENGYSSKTTRYGKAVSVQDVEGLHKLLACKLVEKTSALTGKEFRFVRVQLRLTQEGLAKLMDVTEGAVSLWERKDVVPRANDQLIRLMTLGQLDGNARVRDAIERVQTVQKLVSQKYLVRELDHKREVVVMPTRAATKPHARAAVAA